jgi:hypothetical protein
VEEVEEVKEVVVDVVAEASYEALVLSSMLSFWRFNIT